MAKENAALLAFNRGMVSRLALARVDLKRMALSAEEQTNWMPRVLGSMMLRPGLGYKGSTLENKKSFHVPFVFSTNDTAICELTDFNMRVRVDDDIIVIDQIDTVIRDTDFSTSVDTPVEVTGALTGTNSGAITEFSSDGNFCVSTRSSVSTSQIPFDLYSIKDGAFTLLANQASVAHGLGSAITNVSAKFHPTKKVLFVMIHGASVGTRMFLYKYDENGVVSNNAYTGGFLGISNSSGTNNDYMAISPNGEYLAAVSESGSPYCAVYTLASDGETITGITTAHIFNNSGGTPAGQTTGVAWSKDGDYLAFSHATTPFVHIYKLTDGVFDGKAANPATLPVGGGNSVAFHPSETIMSVSHASSPYVSHYQYSTGTFVKLTNPGTLPAGAVNYIAWSPLGNEFFATSPGGGPPNHVRYSYSNGAFTALASLVTPVTGPTVNYHPGGSIIALTSASVKSMWVSGPWHDADEGSAASVIDDGLTLTGTGASAAVRLQYVWVASGDIGQLHRVDIHVVRGAALLRVGTTSGAEDILGGITLSAGYHSLTFTPESNFFIALENSDILPAEVEYLQLGVAGDMIVPTPWAEADLSMIRYDQSGDVIFVACDGYRPMRIERRDNDSWSVVEYAPEDGPFRVVNTSGITLTPSGISGTITIEASANYFKESNVGGLFKLTSGGQLVTADLSAADSYTDSIKVTGINEGRIFQRSISGTWAGKITLQRSVAEPGNWTNTNKTNTANLAASNYDDTFDNQVMYYRAGFRTGDYTSGTATVTLDYSSGSIDGVVRITRFIDERTVEADVLKSLGGTDPTSNWAEGLWSDRRGWPSAVGFHDGRLWWAGKDKIIGSISDAFDSFDDAQEGDAGPINRSIGTGPVDVINWLLATQNLLIGTEGSELLARSSTLDEPLTPTQFGLKPVSTQGSSRVAAVKVDTSGIFVQRNGSRLYELSLDSTAYSYASNDITAIIPEIGYPGIVKLVVQRQPDTRIHALRSDGKVAVLVFDKVENVTCWIMVETDGLIEDAVILPGATEDSVYYVVNRTIDGNTKRYFEKWALEREAIGGAVNKMADSFIEYSGVATDTITGLGHLEGEQVVVWGNAKDLGSYTVTGGAITLTEDVTLAYVGLPYQARFKSAKLALAAAMGTPLTQKKRVDHLGLILADTHAQGLRYGPDFDTLDDLPLTEKYEEVDPDYIWTAYDMDSFEFNGEWSTDSRICLEAAAPRPATVLAAVITISTNDKG